MFQIKPISQFRWGFFEYGRLRIAMCRWRRVTDPSHGADARRQNGERADQKNY